MNICDLNSELSKLSNSTSSMSPSEIAEKLVELASKVDTNLNSNNNALKHLIENIPVISLPQRIQKCQDALSQYADPHFYRAIMIIPDRPAGGFADDLD